MSKRFKSLVAISIGFVVFSAVGAYLIDAGITGMPLSMQTFANVISSVSALVTVSIACLLYRRFSGNQLLVDKQTEEVIGLLTFISTLRFSCQIIEDRATTITHFNIQVTDYQKRLTTAHLPRTNYASPAFIDAIWHLSEQARSLYLPKNIAHAIERNLNICTARSVKTTDVAASYCLVSVQGNFNNIERADIDESSSQYESFISRINNVGFAYEHWMRELQMVYQLCYTWLEANNVDVFDSLNIQPIDIS